MEITSISNTVITALITAVVSVIVFYIKEKIKRHQEYEKNTNLCLNEHPFFVRTEILKSNIQNTFTLVNKGKEVVFKDIICNLIDNMEIVLSELSKRIDKGQIKDSTELYNEHIEALNRIIEKHHSYYKNNIIYTKEEQDVLDVVMKKFDIWNQSRIEFIQEQIMSVCNSPFYKTEKIKAAVILDLYFQISVSILADAEKTLNSINGELKGFVFRNIKI